MIKMTAHEFKSARDIHLSKPGGREPWQITDVVFSEPLELTDDGRNIPALNFIQCQFDLGLTIKSANGYNSLDFAHCIFQDDVDFGRIISNVSWTNCSFKKSLIIGGAQSALVLSGFDISGTLKLYGNFEQALTIKAINSASGFAQPGSLFFASGFNMEVTIQDCRFEDVNLGNSRVYNQTIRLEGLDTGIVNVNHMHIGNWLQIKQSRIQELKIDNLKGNRRYIELTDNTISTLWIASHMIDQLKIEGKTCELSRFWGDVSKDTIMEIRSIQFRSLVFDELYNEGRVTFRGVSVTDSGDLSIYGSTLGKCSFVKCDFSKALLRFDNSKIAEIFVAETDFPHHVADHVRRSHSQAQLVFGQLRTAFEKQGDTVRSLEYQAREISAHYRNIRSFWNRFPRPHFTKLSLWLNKISNDFGRDWGRGVVFSIGLGLTFFILLLWSTDNYSLHGRWQWDERLIPSFFRFMNPLRFFDLEALFKKDGNNPYITLTSWSYLVDFLGRVGLAYGYYQTIQAFRRYGRK